MARHPMVGENRQPLADDPLQSVEPPPLWLGILRQRSDSLDALRAHVRPRRAAGILDRRQCGRPRWAVSDIVRREWKLPGCPNCFAFAQSHLVAEFLPRQRSIS